MGRLCGGAHEISGIPVQLWLNGWVVREFIGWVVVGVDGGVVGSGWVVDVGVGGAVVYWGGVGGSGWWWGNGDGVGG